MKRATAVLVSTLFSLTLAVSACGSSESEESAGEPQGESADEAAEAAEDTAAQIYTVRGRVDVLPTDAEPRMQIYHEEIPDFVNIEGEVSGMAAMSMPFGVAEGVSLEGLEAGDFIEFTFEVDWDTDDRLRVTAIDELPEDIELELD